MTTLRKLFVVFGAALLALGVSGSAGANPLNWAGTSTLLLGDFPPVGISGGGVATVNGSGGLGHVDSLRLAASRGGINGTFSQFVTDPDTAGNSILKIEYDGITGGTGTFAPISGVVGSTFAFLTQNVLPVKGTVRLCLLTTDCNDFLEIILTQQTANGTIGVGVGGLLTVGGDTPIKISIQGAPWTIKTATVVDHITTTNKVNQLFITKKLKGFAHGPASGTTTTAQPSGVVQLVSPAQVQTNLPLGSNKKVSSGQILRIHFIPEPGLLLLLGSGVAGLAILGRRRLRK
jgi:hypothetical protein